MSPTPDYPPVKPRSRWPDWLPGGSIAGLIGGLSWLVGVMALGFSLLQLFSEWRYKTDGATATGLVTKLVTSDVEDGTTYHVEYRFDTPHGRVDGSSEVALEVWNTLKVNAQVGVQYRAHDPSSSRLQGQDNWVSIAFAAPLGAVFFGIGMKIKR